MMKKPEHVGVEVAHRNAHSIINCENCKFIHAVTQEGNNHQELYKSHFYTEEKPNYIEDNKNDAEWWDLIDLKANVPSGGPVTLHYGPAEGARHILHVDSADAGAVLAALGISQSVRGGSLLINAEAHDNEPHRPLKGGVLIKDHPHIKVRCLPTAIPEELEVSIVHLDLERIVVELNIP